jgi:predicted nucleic acid-binding Zn ribbon protein
MPVYEFECDNCGFISEKFYRSIPRIDPMQIVEACINCHFVASHKKLMSFNSFHLKGGKSPWGEDKFSSCAPTGDTPVSIDEPS